LDLNPQRHLHSLLVYGTPMGRRPTHRCEPFRCPLHQPTIVCWLMVRLWVVDQRIGANPSDVHCTNPPCKAFVHHWDTFKTGSTSVASASASNGSRAIAPAKAVRCWNSTTLSCSPTTSGLIRYPAARSGHGALQRLAGLRPGGWGRRSCRRLRLRGPPPKCKEGGAQTRIVTATAACIPRSPRASSTWTLGHRALGRSLQAGGLAGPSRRGSGIPPLGPGMDALQRLAELRPGGLGRRSRRRHRLRRTLT